MIPFVPEIHAGWIGNVKGLFHSSEIAYVKDSELLSALSRGHREAFRILAGCRAKDYLLGSRVGYGLWLMEEKGLTGARAAQDAGFHDSSHFVRTTRALTGLPPNSYLNRLELEQAKKPDYDATALLHALTRLPLKSD
jgi:AraC-like DNA-binding protein